MTKAYGVTIPISGYLYKEVEAESEEEDIDIAMQEASLDDLGEWDMFEKLVEGNVCHTYWTEVEIDELE